MTSETISLDPTTAYSQPPQPAQQQDMPGSSAEMRPTPDYGEESYQGSGLLTGRSALITGGDSGIGRAVAIAFAREGPDILISYLEEEEADAAETAKWVEQAGRKAIRMPGDIQEEAHCKRLVARAMEEFGRLDILVNNAAHQATFGAFEGITSQEWERTFRINIHAQFYLAKAAVPLMKKTGKHHHQYRLDPGKVAVAGALRLCGD